jgi:hypothetical protein
MVRRSWRSSFRSPLRAEARKEQLASSWFYLFPSSLRLKGKCALGPFLSILVIECQRKCFYVNLCKVVDKVQIMSKGMFLYLVHCLWSNVLCLSAGNRKNRIENEMAKFCQNQSSLGAPDCPMVHRTVSGAPGWLERTSRSREFIGDVRL